MRASEGKVRAGQGGLLGQFPSSEKSVTQEQGVRSSCRREMQPACRGSEDPRDQGQILESRMFVSRCPTSRPPQCSPSPSPSASSPHHCPSGCGRPLSPLPSPLSEPHRSRQRRTRLTGPLFRPLQPLLLARGGKKVPSKAMSGPRQQTRVADLDRGP